MKSIRKLLFKKKKKTYFSREQITSHRVLEKVRKTMEKDKLYLNPELNLNSLAEAIGTNRTYLAKAFKDSDTTCKQFINSYRITHLLSALENRWVDSSNADMMAHTSGFTTRRLMDKVLLESLGETYCELKKRKK